MRITLFSLLAFNQVASAAGPVWDDTNTTAAAAPENRRGGNPSYSDAPWNPNLGTTGARLEDDGGAMSGNFRLSIPMLSFPGRGAPLSLDIYYSSQLWAQMPDQSLVFDPDADWPAPGWSIGFGKIVVTRGVGAVLIGPDNSRQTVYQRNPIGGSVRYMGIVGNATASLEICCMGVGADQGRKATYFDGHGRTVDYVTSTPGAKQAVYYPLQTTDANGNMVTIKYALDSTKRPAPPAIDYITDTVGRNIHFHYDGSQRLVSVTGPGLEREHRVYARFLYSTADVSIGVGPDCTPFSQSTSVLTGVVLPGTNVGYWLSPANRYGISTSALETRGVRLRVRSMKSPATLISQGIETKRTTFDYPDPVATNCIKQAPAYTAKTEQWDDPVSGDKKVAVTKYARAALGKDNVMTVTLPDGSVSRQFIANESDASKYVIAGQVRRIENANADGTILSSTDFEWDSQVPQAYGAPRQRAVVENIDPLGVGKRTSFDYDASLPLLVTNAYHYAYTSAGIPAGVQWATQTRYLQDPAYTAARLIGLPQSVTRFNGLPSVEKPVSRTDIEYDGTPLAPVGSLRQHSASFEPHNIRVCDRYETDNSSGKPKRICVQYKEVPAAWVTKRGNVSKVTRFADPSAAAGLVSVAMTYDTAGNVLQRTDDSGNGASYAYEPKSFLSLPSVATVGATSPASPYRISTSFDYYLGAGLLRTASDAAGRATHYRYQPGPTGWRAVSIGRPDGTTQNHTFNDTGLGQQSSLTDVANKVYQLVESRFDGRGALRSRTTYLGADRRIEETEYDLMGRVSRQALAHPQGQTPIWATRTYDALGRVTATTSNGEASMQFAYDEKTAAPASVPAIPVIQGSTLRTTDAWGRQRWTQRDISGNPKYLVEPDAADSNIFGPSALFTHFDFDSTGLLRTVVSGTQIRRFVYDGLGRLVAQALPERNLSLDVSGTYNGNASLQKYSDVFQYDNRSNLVVSTDSRGVRSVLDFCLFPHGPSSPCLQVDPLNRMQAMHYEVPAVADTSSEIVPAPSVTMAYKAGADQMRIASVSVDGVETVVNTYDAIGRPTDQTTTLSAYPTVPLTLTLAYDSIGRVSTLTYPIRYGSDSMRHVFGFGYDSDVLSSAKLDGAPLVSDIKYEAGGRVKALTLSTASGSMTEAFDTDPVLGLPSGMSATDSNGVRRMALEYRYRRQDVSVTGRTETPGIVGSLTAIRNLLDDHQTQDFDYDVLGRLAWAATGDSKRPVFDPLTVSWQGYAYDRFGNRTAEHAFRQVVGHSNCVGGCATIELDEEHHDGVSSLTFDAATNRITSPGFAYDAAGNLTHGVSWSNGSYEPRTYKYDAAGRLVQVLAGNNGPLIEAYKYGAGNQRLADSPDGTAWNYLIWLGNHIVAKFGAPSGQAVPVWSESTYFLGERLIATEVPDNNGVSSRQHFNDHRGVSMTVMQKNGTAQFVNQAVRPFGTESNTQLDWLTTRRFTTYDRAGVTGDDNAVNRTYLPRVGRFLQTDPAGASSFNTSESRSLNAYAYAVNDPINKLDADGLVEKDWFWRYCYDDGKPCGNWVYFTTTGTNDASNEPPLEIVPTGDPGEGPPEPDTRKCIASNAQRAKAPSLMDEFKLVKYLLGGAGFSGAFKLATARILRPNIIGNVPFVRVGQMGVSEALVAEKAFGPVMGAATAGYTFGGVINEVAGWMEGQTLGDQAFDRLNPLDTLGAFDPIAQAWVQDPNCKGRD